MNTPKNTTPAPHQPTTNTTGAGVADTNPGPARPAADTTNAPDTTDVQGATAAAGPFTWTPLHTPALARAIFNHPATAHLPPAALTDLLHTAGHDLAHRAKTHLNHRLTPTQTQDFLTHHNPTNPAPGTAWIRHNLPHHATLLTSLTTEILDDITAGPYQYLNTHHPTPTPTKTRHQKNQNKDTGNP